MMRQDKYVVVVDIFCPLLNEGISKPLAMELRHKCRDSPAVSQSSEAERVSL